jgi:hypothetical protein
MCRAPETAFGAVTTLFYFAWWLSHPTWWIDVDGLAYRLRCPMNHGCQVCVQSLLIGAVPSHRTAWGGAALVHHSRGCEAPGSRCLTWCWPPGPWWAVTLMERCAFTKPFLSRIRVIMTIMCILVIELLCQMVMGCPLVLEYLLSGTCGYLWPCLIVPGIKGHHFPRTRLRRCLSDGERPREWLPGARVCLESGRWGGLGWQMVKSYPSMPIKAR